MPNFVKITRQMKKFSIQELDQDRLQFIWQLYAIVIRFEQFLRKQHHCLRQYSMPNFMKIPRRMKEFSIQALYSDRSVCMAAICCRHPISAIPTNEQLLGEKRTCTKFQFDISKTQGLVRVYTDRQTNKSTKLVSDVFFWVL